MIAAPWGQVLTVIGVLGGLWWVADRIGDAREAKVHARYAAQAQATNLAIQEFNSEDERVAAIAEALRAKAAAEALATKGDACIVSEERAAALNRIY